MRNDTLDVLRAVAVLLVFSRHTEGALIVSHLGWVGVDLFFVLSGFLVSGLLFREYKQGHWLWPGRFLIRRGFKIYPQFYLLIAVTIAATLLSGRRLNGMAAIAEIAFFQNYTSGIWAYTWSLAVEEHFYLLLTLGLAILARRGGDDPFRCLPRWILGACAFILGLRILTWYWYPQTSDYIHIFPSHLRMDSLLWGVLLSYFSVFRPGDIRKLVDRFGAWLPQASILLLAPTALLDQSHPFIYTIGFSMVSIGFGLLLLTVLNPTKPRGRSGATVRALARLGRVSYAFYLWHGAVLLVDDRLLASWMASGFRISMPANLAVTFGATLAIALLTTWLVERPFLRWRERRFPSRVQARVTSAVRGEEMSLAMSSGATG